MPQVKGLSISIVEFPIVLPYLGDPSGKGHAQEMRLDFMLKLVSFTHEGGLVADSLTLKLNAISDLMAESCIKRATIGDLIAFGVRYGEEEKKGPIGAYNPWTAAEDVFLVPFLDKRVGARLIPRVSWIASTCSVLVHAGWNPFYKDQKAWRFLGR